MQTYRVTAKEAMKPHEATSNPLKPQKMCKENRIELPCINGITVARVAKSMLTNSWPSRTCPTTTGAPIKVHILVGIFFEHRDLSVTNDYDVLLLQCKIGTQVPIGLLRHFQGFFQ